MKIKMIIYFLYLDKFEFVFISFLVKRKLLSEHSKILARKELHLLKGLNSKTSLGAGKAHPQ